MIFGGREYPLLPTFGALENFESRHGSVAKHLMSMMDASATLKVRSFLVYQGMKAHRDENFSGEVRGEMTPESVAMAMFEEGVLNEAMTLREVEFIERLLYTPEEYQAKKHQRAILEAEMMKLQGASSNSLDSLWPTSNGRPLSSTDALQESSGPS